MHHFDRRQAAQDGGSAAVRGRKRDRLRLLSNRPEKGRTAYFRPLWAVVVSHGGERGKGRAVCEPAGEGAASERQGRAGAWEKKARPEDGFGQQKRRKRTRKVETNERSHVPSDVLPPLFNVAVRAGDGRKRGRGTKLIDA